MDDDDDDDGDDDDDDDDDVDVDINPFIIVAHCSISRQLPFDKLCCCVLQIHRCDDDGHRVRAAGYEPVSHRRRQSASQLLRQHCPLQAYHHGQYNACTHLYVLYNQRIDLETAFCFE
jgi:hypothetical protein